MRAAIVEIAVALLIFGLVAVPERATAGTCVATNYPGWHPNDPTKDSSLGMTNALKNCAGQSIHIPAGSYYFLVKGIQPGFQVPANTSIYGDTDVNGNPTTVLAVGAPPGQSGNLDFVFKIIDVSNVAIDDIEFMGSQYGTNCPNASFPGNGNAIFVSSYQGPQAVQNISINHNIFHDFNGQLWIYIYSFANAPGVGTESLIDISNNVFDARGIGHEPLNNCAGSVGLGYDVYQIWMEGSTTTASGKVENVSVASNTFYSTYVKGAVGIHGGDLQRISVQYNHIYDAGTGIVETSGSNDLGRYAIQVYTHVVPCTQKGCINASPITNVWVVGNQIVNPYSCGIYVASAVNMQISNNSISGQVDGYDVYIPKGGIALNGLLNPYPLPQGSVDEVFDNNLSENLYGIEIVGGSVTMDSNSIVNVPEGGYGMKIWLDNPADPVSTTHVILNNSTISTTVTDASPTSLLGYSEASLGTNCSGSATLPSGALSISGLTQIGWPSTDLLVSARSLTWFDSSHGCLFHGFGPGEVPYLEPTSGLISNVTRQATANSAPVAQTVFFPFSN